MTICCSPGGSAWLLASSQAGMTRSGAVLGDAVGVARAGGAGRATRRPGPARPGGSAVGRLALICAPSTSSSVVGPTPRAFPPLTVVGPRRGGRAVVPDEDRAEVRAPRFGAGGVRCRVRRRDLVRGGQPAGGRRPPA